MSRHTQISIVIMVHWWNPYLRGLNHNVSPFLMLESTMFSHVSLQQLLELYHDILWYPLKPSNSVPEPPAIRPAGPSPRCNFASWTSWILPLPGTGGDQGHGEKCWASHFQETALGGGTDCLKPGKIDGKPCGKHGRGTDDLGLSVGSQKWSLMLGV